MRLFTSQKEKKLWLWALIVTGAIYSTLFVSKPLIALSRNQDFQAAIFLLSMALIGGTIITYVLKKKPKKIEISLFLGLAAVYLMLFIRLGMSERTHLVEYSILAVFIYKAIDERLRKVKSIKVIALLALFVSSMIGTLDECIQILLPDRVFDPVDIFFNLMASTFAIGSIILLSWLRNLKNKSSVKSSK